MIGVKTRMALFFAVVLGIAGLCVLAVYHQSPEPREKFRKRNFDRTVAEGMRLWNPKAGVDSIRFAACRIEKMRMGAFALGGFNVLCLDGLVLNLPLPEEEGMRDQGLGIGDQGKKKGAVVACRSWRVISMPIASTIFLVFSAFGKFPKARSLAC